MEKKLRAQGPRKRKSYTVTLPIEWVKEYKLDKTRSVDLELVGSKAVVSAKRSSLEQVRIDGDLARNNLIKILQSLYRTGVADIEVTFSEPMIATEILEIVERALLGYEIVEQRKGYVHIQEIFEESSSSFKTILRRIFLLALELAGGDTNTVSADRTIKKLINYAQRTLMKKGHSEYKKVPLYYLILDRIEKLCDELKWIREIEQKPPFPYEQITELLRNAYLLLFTFDEKVYQRCQFQSYELKNQVKRGKQTPLMTHLHNSARILNSLYADIYAVIHA